MKQEWFESNDFVNNNKQEQNLKSKAQEVADKTEETIADLDTPKYYQYL